MATFRLFHPKTFVEVASVASSEILSLNFTAGLKGSLSGEAEIEVTSSNVSLLRSLGENSHYLKVSTKSDMHGAIISSCSITKNVAKVSFIGFFEYLDKITLIPSNKAGVVGETKTIAENDESFVKTIYADGGIGLLYTILRNLEKTMTVLGFSRFWSYGNLLSSIEDLSSSTWQKSFRLNITDLTTVKSAIDEVLSEEDGAAIKVTVSNSGDFQWNLNVVSSFNQVSINEATDSIFDIERTEGEDIKRTESWASGSDLKDNEQISRLIYDNSVAFSSYSVDEKVEGNASLARKNQSAINGLRVSQDQIAFKSFLDGIKVLDLVSISSAKMPLVKAVITEVVFDGNEVSYTGQITESSEDMFGISKPLDQLRKAIFKPLNDTRELAKKTNLSGKRGTGFRS